MSAQNLEIVRRGYEHFAATGELLGEAIGPEFVWDMSTFRDWPERQTYQGMEGAQEFLADWREAWEDWRLEVEEYRAAGDKVVVVARQRGRAKATGLPVDMHFAQVWTVRDGMYTRMEMYADPGEALRAVGLGEAGAEDATEAG
ncbi:MAG: nuclear transport factor 2 family protein [Actinomycetota bacterium]